MVSELKHEIETFRSVTFFSGVPIAMATNRQRLTAEMASGKLAEVSNWVTDINLFSELNMPNITRVQESCWRLHERYERQWLDVAGRLCYLKLEGVFSSGFGFSTCWRCLSLPWGIPRWSGTHLHHAVCMVCNKAKHQTAMRLKLRSGSKLQTLIVLPAFCFALEPWLDFRHHVDPERSGINEIKTSETWRKPQQIPRRRGLSLAAYQEEFEGQIPVVLEGVYEKMDCLKDGWIEKMIMEPFKDERVIFLAHKNGAERIMATKLRKFVKNVNKNYQNAWSYLRDDFFLKRHPDLIAACPPLPPFLEGQDYFSLMPAMFLPANATLLWGGRYSRSKLHVDPYNWTGTNLVLRGEKFFRLIPPGGHDRMLEVVTKNCGMALECISYESNKDLFESVPQGIPLWETKLQNGELLIIPSGWWHQAVNLGNTLAMVCALSGRDLLILNKVVFIGQQMRRKGIRKMTWNHQLANLNS